MNSTLLVLGGGAKAERYQASRYVVSWSTDLLAPTYGDVSSSSSSSKTSSECAQGLASAVRYGQQKGGP